jgi:hypothetical protein
MYDNQNDNKENINMIKITNTYSLKMQNNPENESY